MGVSQLGYLGLNVSDPDAWLDLMTKVFGLEVRERKGKDSPLQFRVDDHHHRLALYPAKSDGLQYIGWEVPSLDELKKLADRLNSIGISITQGTPAEADERKVLAFYKFHDPDSLPAEIYYGPIIDHNPLGFGRPISGFISGRLGLGHLVFACADQYKSAEFYMKELGFRLSDYIAWEDADAIFMHCNPRHHSLALVNPVFGMKPGELHHLMIETTSMDDVGRAYDLVLERKIPLILRLGRHTNDLMTSFYIKNPSGFSIEYGYGGRLIEDDAKWEVRRYSATQLWGHQFAMLENPVRGASMAILQRLWRPGCVEGNGFGRAK